MANDTQSRKYLLTINNPQEKNLSHDIIRKTLEENFQSLIYYCLSDEVGGKEQTHHTHIFILFSSPVRFSTIKNNFPTAHIDKSRGTTKENRDYVFKEGKWQSTEKSETNLNETHFEYGELPDEKPGRRSDLNELYQSIKDGQSNAEILETNPSSLVLLNHIDRTRKIILEEKFRTTWRDVKVTYIFGTTGVGKTRTVMEHFGYTNIYRVTDYEHPFDSYGQQPVLLLDEFAGQIQIQSLLNLLDGYPLELPCRYANKVACFTRVFIISNLPLSQQYFSEQYDYPEVWNALLRRIHSLYEFSENSCYTYADIRFGGKKNSNHSNIVRVGDPLSIADVISLDFISCFNNYT